ncbi:hypothetical protein HBB16_18045 [Pseudonocardia sp. MCCB 268]|nr:hypothetical protein [Pseudonocardia cytotoxica]
MMIWSWSGAGCRPAARWHCIGPDARQRRRVSGRADRVGQSVEAFAGGLGGGGVEPAGCDGGGCLGVEVLDHLPLAQARR